MAYEATKRIKGRDYRFLVEGDRDPRTRRVRRRWYYVGRVLEDGAIAASSSHWRRASRERIAAAGRASESARDLAGHVLSLDGPLGTRLGDAFPIIERAILL